MRPAIEDVQEVFRDGHADLVPGNMLVVALPIYNPMKSDTPVVNGDGVVVGDEQEWRRIPWPEVLGAAEPES